MRVLIIASLCVLAVLGSPHPDSALKLEDPKIAALAKNTVDALAAETESEIVTTPKPEPQSEGTVEDRTRLVTSLFAKYNKRVNPDVGKVKFGVALTDFRVLEESNALFSNVWLRLVWKDERLAWNPEEYGGTKVLRFDPNEVWRPDITLYNSADPVNMNNCWDANVLIYSNGEVLHVPPCKMISQCNFNLKKHPYGEQECTMKFGSWTFDGNVMDLIFYDKKEGMDLEDLHNTSGFEVVSTTAEKHTNYYPCCPEPYPDLTFNITVKRIPGDELFSKL